MSVKAISAQPPPLSPRSPVRVEYLDFKNLPDYREYRLASYGPDGPSEFRFRIASAAFDAGQVRLQDGPEVCYQALMQAIAAGQTTSADVVTIDDAGLASYREAHAPKRRSWTPPSSVSGPFVPPTPPRRRSPEAVVAPPAPRDAAPAFDDGRRVSHAAFGVGVTTSSSGGHTTVCFDEKGPKTFVTSMLKLELLSAPHTWETSPRGKNRLCETTRVAG
jgi:hypothetical protein